MREMILNQASILHPRALPDVVAALKDLARGMAQLVQDQCASASLRSRNHWHEIPCTPNASLFDAVRTLLASGSRDEAVFLMRLAQKSPLLTDLGEAVIDRFLRCEAANVEEPYGEALVLCAHISGISISFPFDANWTPSTLTVTFSEMVETGDIEEAAETIDNVASLSNSIEVLERHRALALNAATPETLWNERERLFPSLLFGPDVERHLASLNPGLFDTVVRRLSDLDRSARDWRALGGGAPPWRCKVSPESERVMNSDRLREARRFRSAAGEPAIFMWHARFGSSGRIHLQFDAATRMIEIGYIGFHLPLN